MRSGGVSEDPTDPLLTDRDCYSAGFHSPKGTRRSTASIAIRTARERRYET